MNGAAVRPTFVSDAIVVDEVGLESGVYGRYRLRSSYQPIFERSGQQLVPVAVEGLISPHLAGKPIAPRPFFAGVPAGDRLFIESMCRALHLRNHHNIGVDRLELFFNYDPCANFDIERSNEIRFMVRRLAEIGLDPGLLVCEITEAAALDPVVLAGLAAEMRRHRVRIAVDDFGSGYSTLERVALIRPEIVKIDGDWFRKLCREPAAIRLFGLLVAGLQQRRAKVLIAGIEQPLHLRHALTAGGDLFQGFCLGRPALVGTVFDETPLAIADLLGDLPDVAALPG